MMPGSRRVLSRVLLSLVSALLPLVTVEIVLRVLDVPAWDTEVRCGWKARSTETHVNELGYRGQPIRYAERDVVVLLVGDSQVEATACEPEWMPARCLERHLRRRDPRFRVFSLGSCGYGTDQEYLALQQYYRRYRADAVIVWQTFSNDVWNNVFPTHWPADGPPKPTFWLEHGVLRGPNHGLDELLMRPARTKIGVLLNRWLHPQKGLDRAWESRLPRPYQPLAHSVSGHVTDWEPSSDPGNRMLAEENLRNEKSHYAVLFTPPSERMQYGLELTRKLTARIQDLTREHRSEFLLLDVRTPEPPNRDEVIVRRRDGLYYRTSLRQAHANQESMNRGFPVLSIPVRVENWRLSASDSHLNRAANDQVMSDLGAKVADLVPARR